MSVDQTRARLPTLSEVLMRKTRPPLDLYCFYIFLQQEAAEDALDFWLDVQQHENLCRAYFKDLRKNNIPLTTEWPEFVEHAYMHGSIFSYIAGIDSDEGEKSILEPSGHNVTDASRYRDASQDHGRDHGDNDSARTSQYEKASQPMTPVQRPRSPMSAPHTPNPDQPLLRPPVSAHSDGASASGSDGSFYAVPRDQASKTELFDKSRLPFKRNVSGARRVSKTPNVIPRNQAVTKDDIRESGERIFATYLVQGAEKEIYLPSSMRILDFPSQSFPGAPVDPSIPDYFHEQKEYIFGALEEDAFVRFLRANAFSNLTRLSTYLRLFLGLFCLWAGLVVAFTLVFLDYKPKVSRLGLIVPFFLAAYFLLSAFYSLSPILVFLKRSETKPFRLIKIGEPYVAKILRGRAALIMVLTIIATAILTVIWWAVPGRRL